MPRQRTGSVIKRGKGKNVSWWARVRYVDEVTGETRDKTRRAESKAHASELRDQLVREFDSGGQTVLETDRKTFAELCDHYEAHYLTEAQYHEGRKVSGLRSLETQEGILKTLREHFGHKRLRAIRYEDVRTFRAARLKTPTQRDVARHKREAVTNPGAELRTTRSIASVNRELALLRRMLNVGLRAGWLLRNPFNAGEPLISTADERKRERILMRDEEHRLLAACCERTTTYKARRGGRVVEITVQDKRREHLRAIIIAALDTGCRQGELLKLWWRDVDLAERSIVIQALNTKTLRERTVAMTTRLYLELEKLWNESSKDPSARVFGIADNVKTAFTAARNQAGLPDLRFHDLRHSAASRLVSAHIPLSEVGKILGHQQPQTTWRYVNANGETVRRAAAALEAFNNQPIAEASEPGGMVN
jgi:integrase